MSPYSGLGCKGQERIFDGARAMKPWKTSSATYERRSKCRSSLLSFAACQTTDHWFLDRSTVGLIRCINVTLEHRGNVSLSHRLGSAAFGDERQYRGVNDHV